MAPLVTERRKQLGRRATSFLLSSCEFQIGQQRKTSVRNVQIFERDMKI